MVNTAYSLFIISELTALHDILVLLLSCNALADKCLSTLPSLRRVAGCSLNPLSITLSILADISLILK